MDRNFGLYVIDKARWVVLTTIGEDHLPYTVPVSPVKAISEKYTPSICLI